MMTRANRLIKIIVVLSIVTVALIERARASEIHAPYKNLNSLRETYRIVSNDIMPYSVIQGDIDMNTYSGNSNTYVLTKNLLSDDESQTNTNSCKY